MTRKFLFLLLSYAAVTSRGEATQTPGHHRLTPTLPGHTLAHAPALVLGRSGRDGELHRDPVGVTRKANHPYEYQYAVRRDQATPHSGHDTPHFGHSEVHDGYKRKGKYFVHLPDGRVQTVTYYADETGYHPTVSYEGTAHYDAHAAAPHHAPANAYHAPEPAYRAPEPAYHAPEPAYRAPGPAYRAPGPAYHAPEPTYHAPEPTYAPEPAYKDPRPTYHAPGPKYRTPQPSYKSTFSTPKPAYKDPESIYHVSEPAHNIHKPVHHVPGSKYSTFKATHAPEPTHKAPKSAYVAPEPAYLAPELRYRTPEPGYHSPEPAYHTPEPTYHASEPAYHAPEHGAHPIVPRPLALASGRDPQVTSQLRHPATTHLDFPNRVAPSITLPNRPRPPPTHRTHPTPFPKQTLAVPLSGLRGRHFAGRFVHDLLSTSGNDRDDDEDLGGPGPRPLAERSDGHFDGTAFDTSETLFRNAVDSWPDLRP
ncbi:extensin-1-like [Penaeus japonicus]|uniref:extensin-1-like n=1 Tax=Penaeus japonicus TaxID=27405 RepID=UPI001C70E54E|nr:extensin-1-like [Penaeus japonicus]